VKRVATLDSRIVEVGCGVGDILIRLAEIGFCNLLGIERDPGVHSVATERAKALGFGYIELRRGNYPIRLEIRSNVLLQINCMYFDDLTNRDEFGCALRRWSHFNGESDVFLVETVDSSYTSLEHTRFPGKPTEFNPHCRVSQADMKSFFPEYHLWQVPSSEPTRVPKTIFLISKHDYGISLEDLMTPV